MKIIYAFLNLLEKIVSIIGIALVIYFLYYLVTVFFPLISEGVIK